ncbi:pilus assembly protein [Roseovarius faecimaris]|uniref:Pilus assembly protein n=1 Tax=Roseovarius faecimaris TaxID=2494550 RepID=A0A6I6IXJ3_9RHOB|nr:TadE family protein [Roseovarius faecimaris]QGY00207.1 pilus assembly protein [Roseovarius faecimaris]
MVSVSLKRFWTDERGLSLTETLLIMPIVLTILIVMVEAGVAVFQWNQSTKAAQIGARVAAVSSPIVGDTAYAALSADWTSTGEGDSVNGSTIAVSCGPSGPACDQQRLARLLTGSDTNCDPLQTTLGAVVGMCDVAPFIGLNNVQVTYYRSGLGYIGRPGGPVTNITVELRNLTFDFLLLDDLIPAFGTLTMPAQPVSITSEDVNDCKDTCP